VASAPLLFCGDTLFSAAAAAVRRHAGADAGLAVALAALPGDTRVCCTHEYTLSNLRFAAAVEPGNAGAGRYTRSTASALRAGGQPTLPSTLGTERRSTRSCAAAKPAVIAAVRAQGAATASRRRAGRLREWKNRFR
jgi:hydroxyacylglutathione hydrolase